MEGMWVLEMESKKKIIIFKRNKQLKANNKLEQIVS